MLLEKSLKTFLPKLGSQKFKSQKLIPFISLWFLYFLHGKQQQASKSPPAPASRGWAQEYDGTPQPPPFEPIFFTSTKIPWLKSERENKSEGDLAYIFMDHIGNKHNPRRAMSL